MNSNGYTYEVVFIEGDTVSDGGALELPVQILSENRFVGGTAELPDPIYITGTIVLPDGSTWTLPVAGSADSGSLILEHPCKPNVPITDTDDLTLARTFILELVELAEDHQTFRIFVSWTTDSATGATLGALEREWFVETPRRGANFVALTFEFNHSTGDPLSSFESVRFQWSSDNPYGGRRLPSTSAGEIINKPLSLEHENVEEVFRLPLLENKGDEFVEVDTRGPLGIPFSSFRAWAAPLRAEEVRSHQMDWLAWGTEFPLDEMPSRATTPQDGLNQPSEDPFDDGTFPARAWIEQARSRRRRLLLSSWDSFALRGLEDAPFNPLGDDAPEERRWKNSITPEVFEISEEDFVRPFTFLHNSWEANWDESNALDPIRTFLDEIKNEINPTEQPVGDWRFAIEFSSQSATARDLMRSMSDITRIDDMVGAPEWLSSASYPMLRDWSRNYFGSRVLKEQGMGPAVECNVGRLFGPLQYLQAMRLHRWLWANLRGCIDELIPFNVSYLGFHNIIEPLPHERAKVIYPGSDRYLDPLDRLDPQALRLVILNGLIRRF